MGKIYYVSNIRYPTEKAHGYQIAKMCEAFVNTGQEVELVVPRRRNSIIQTDKNYYGLKNHFKVTYLPIFDAQSQTWIPKKLAFGITSLIFLIVCSFLKVENDSIVYTRSPELAKLFSSRGIRTIFECHQLPQRKSTVYSWFIKKALVVAITHGIKNELERTYGQTLKKMLVAPDGVDLSVFNVALDRATARHQLNLPLNKKIILYTGHLYPWKGVDILALAAKNLSPDTQVYMVGGTEQEIIDFKKRAKITDNIFLLTSRPRNEIAIWLKAADALILPNTAKEIISEKYTSPLKLFEYMASGTPIIASGLPSLKEILDDSLAIFYPSDSHEGLKEKIYFVLENPDTAKKIAEKAQAISKNYSWDVRAEKIISFIHS
jgi:glycosyltransferase involved in cell wall biosynthesis